MIIASWNVNSIRARVEQVTAWMKAHNPDVLLLQELKGTEFLVDLFNLKGGDATERQHRCRFFAISTTLMGDDADSHARFLEVIVKDIRIANIYLPNGNPVGSEKFAYKLAWMDRLGRQLARRQLALWLQSDTPTVVGGAFNVIPENIDCHKPASWIHDALFQPEPREWYRAYLSLGYLDAFRTLHPGQGGHFTFWDYFRQAFEHNRGIRIDHFLLSPQLSSRLESCDIDKGPRAQAKPSDHTPIVLQLG